MSSDIAAGRRQPEEDQYDVIVVGSGLGGLSAAAPLARLGRKVLLLERASHLGGCAHALRRGPYTFDAAVHSIGPVRNDTFIDLFLRALGVRDTVEFIPSGSTYGVDLPGLRMTMPLGIGPFIEAHERQFAGRAQGIEEFLEACVLMTAESQLLPPLFDLEALDGAAEQLPFLSKYHEATVADVLDEYIAGDGVKTLCTAAWPYVGLPPSQLSFVTFCAMLLNVIDGGPHYCRGSFQSLVDTFATAIERSGGRIAVDASVRRILVDDGSVSGVELSDGRRFGAPVVISNADATATMESMVGFEHLPPEFVRRLSAMTPSLSAFRLFAATSMDLSGFELPHELFIHHHWDHDDSFREIQQGRLGGLRLTIPTLVDPTLAPEGEHIVVLTSHVPYDIGEPWPQARMRYEELTCQEVERILPGFRASTTHLESATPTRFERWTRNRWGAIHGWENGPSQSTPKRLPRMCPIKGLLLSGHWTTPGSGAVRTIYSGFQTAQLLTGHDSGPDLLAALAAADPANTGRVRSALERR